MSKVLTITQYAKGENGPGGFGGFDVQHGDLIAHGLTLGEMLEQVLALFGHGQRAYPMETVGEIKAGRAIHDADLKCPCDEWPVFHTGYGDIPF